MIVNKKALGFFVSFLLLCVSVPNITPLVRASDPPRYWALIISGSTGLSFSNNTQYMYHVLSQHYTFDGIYYLDVYTDRPGVNASATIANVRWAITNWTANHSDINDIIFIYFTSHGVGYLTNYGFGPFIFHTTYYIMGDHGRVSFETSDENQAREVNESHFRLTDCPRILVYYDLDDDGVYDDFYWDHDNDERIEMIIDIGGTLYDFGELPYIDVDGDGNDDDLFADINSNNQTDILVDAGTWTSDGEDTNNDGIIIGVDLNGDGDFNDWVGVDEGLKVQEETYWDDELAGDLNTLSYAKLIFVRQGCVEEGKGCFSGGLIDDISATNRIIMTATNETWYSYGDRDNDGYSEWSEAFIDALHGEDTHWDNGVVNESPRSWVDADTNHDGHVSLKEAWDYAWDHDDARLEGLETPWLDDDGNGLPTYINETDQLDPDDGDIAASVWFPKPPRENWVENWSFEQRRMPVPPGSVYELESWTTDVHGGWRDLRGDCYPDEGDGDVDPDDYVTFAGAYGSKVGDPGYDFRCDFDGDGDVDPDDYHIFAGDYGKKAIRLHGSYSWYTGEQGDYYLRQNRTGVIGTLKGESVIFEFWLRPKSASPNITSAHAQIFYVIPLGDNVYKYVAVIGDLVWATEARWYNVKVICTLPIDIIAIEVSMCVPAAAYVDCASLTILP